MNEQRHLQINITYMHYENNTLALATLAIEL